jgi:hypothetical protein
MTKYRSLKNISYNNWKINKWTIKINYQKINILTQTYNMYTINMDTKKSGDIFDTYIFFTYVDIYVTSKAGDLTI